MFEKGFFWLVKTHKVQFPNDEVEVYEIVLPVVK